MIVYYYYFTLLIVFHASIRRWFLSGVWETESLFKYTGLFSVFNNADVWMVSTCQLIFKTSSPSINPVEIYPRPPITKDFTITFMLHSFFFSSLTRSRHLFLFSLSLILLCYQPGWQSPPISWFSFFFFFFFFFCLSLHLVVWPRLVDPLVSQNPREVYA